MKRSEGKRALPSLDETSNLPQIAKSKNKLTCLTAQLFELQIIVLVLLCTKCCTGSLTGALRMDFTSNLNLLLNSATFVYRLQSTKTPIHHN